MYLKGEELLVCMGKEQDGILACWCASPLSLLDLSCGRSFSVKMLDFLQSVILVHNIWETLKAGVGEKGTRHCFLLTFFLWSRENNLQLIPVWNKSLEFLNIY